MCQQYVSYCIAERDCDFCECADENECRWKSVHAAKTLVMVCCNFVSFCLCTRCVSALLVVCITALLVPSVQI